MGRFDFLRGAQARGVCEYGGVMVPTVVPADVLVVVSDG